MPTGSGFGSAYPHMIMGCSIDKPGHRVGKNARQALTALEATNLPRRYMVGDMAYYPDSKAANYQIPMREAGWRLVGDIPNRPEVRGIQAEYEGVVVVDGHVLDPRAQLDSGEIDEERFNELIELRSRYAMRVKQINKDGSLRLSCPALEGKVTCPLRRNDAQARKAVAKKTSRGAVPFPLSAKQVPRKAQQGACCTQKSVTVPLHVDAHGAGINRVNKYLQREPATYTDEWREIYKPGRAAIEARNASAKNDVKLGRSDTQKYPNP